MKLHYYPETDNLYIELKTAPGAETREIVDGLVVDFDADGNVVGFDIDHPSSKLDFILATPDLRALGEPRVIVTPASDHLPVVVEVEVL